MTNLSEYTFAYPQTVTHPETIKIYQNKALAGGRSRILKWLIFSIFCLNPKLYILNLRYKIRVMIITLRKISGYTDGCSYCLEKSQCLSTTEINQLAVLIVKAHKGLQRPQRHDCRDKSSSRCTKRCCRAIYNS